MASKVRFLVAGGMLLFLLLLVLFAPGREQVLAVQSGKILEGLLAEIRNGLDTQLAAIGSTMPGDTGSDPRLRALGGSPRAIRFEVAGPPVAATILEGWRTAVDRWAGESAILRLAEDGTPLVLTCDPTRSREISLALAPLPTVLAGRRVQTVTVTARLADLRSLLPPFLTILIAVVFRRTIVALTAGVLLGGFLYTQAPLAAVAHFARHYVWDNVAGDAFQLKILLFVVLLSMAIGIMTKCGGIEGMVELVKRFATSARSSQLVTWIMGLLVFFDDYANTIVVGATMRPLTDRLRVSREKLAYIVDSTAAPVAGLSVLSTWVAYEISTFAPSLPEVTDPTGQPYVAEQGFAVFLDTLPYRFYCIFTLVMVVATILLRREFGPMLVAERRARREGKLIADGARPLVSRALTETQAKSGVPPRWWNGVLPILALLGVTVWQIWDTGRGALTGEEAGFIATIRIVLRDAESTHAIFVGAASAVGLAALLAIGQRLLGPLETLATAARSLGALFFAVVILVLAWSMGDVCKDELGTAYYLVALTEGRLPPLLLPSLLFLLACLVSFAIGSSWSTMAILLPNVVLLAHSFGEQTTLGGPVLMTLSIGAVLEGSIFGDHCSPISDTTVLSSVASASDHLDHVRTQIPYALLVMATAMCCGYLPVALISPALWPLSLLLGIAVIVGFLLWRGRNPEDGVAAPPRVRDEP